LSKNVQLEAASHQVSSFNSLELVQQQMLHGASLQELFYRLLEALVLTAAQR